MEYLIGIIVFILGELLSGLIFMGIGNFICWAFNFAYNFSYWQGLGIAIIVTILTIIFRHTDKN